MTASTRKLRWATHELTLVYHRRDNEFRTPQHLLEELIPLQLPVLRRESRHGDIYKRVGEARDDSLDEGRECRYFDAVYEQVGTGRANAEQ